MWRIVSTMDGDHVGTVLEHIEVGNVITFEDGDVVTVDRVFLNAEGTEMVAAGTHYQMTLIKE